MTVCLHEIRPAITHKPAPRNTMIFKTLSNHTQISTMPVSVLGVVQCGADPHLSASNWQELGQICGTGLFHKLPADRCDAWGLIARAASHPWSCQGGKYCAPGRQHSFPQSTASVFNITSLMLTHDRCFTLKVESAGILCFCRSIQLHIYKSSPLQLWGLSVLYRCSHSFPRPT